MRTNFGFAASAPMTAFGKTQTFFSLKKLQINVEFAHGNKQLK